MASRDEAMAGAGKNKAVLLRVPVEVLQWYMAQAGEQVKAGKATTFNKLMVQDLEGLYRQRGKKGGKK